MALKIQRPFRRVFIKVAFTILIIFVVGVTCLHIWFVNNAKRLLIELVTEKSAGKLKLELSDISFDILSNDVKIYEAFIASTNKANSTITYQVSFRKIVLHTNSIWSLIKKRAVEIRQIKLYDPKIEVFNAPKNSVSNSKNNLSLGMELGKLYNSVQDAISALNTHSISIINAKLILVNKMGTVRSPVIFSNIYFTLKHLNKHDDNKNFTFSSSDQDITLTDGIHKLLFKRLVVRPARSSIIMDSCTIMALPTQISGNNYTIFFKRLALIGVDFDTLYKTNLIRADSAYCENPFVTINVNPFFRNRNVVARELPDLEKILKEFSGNLDLGFVGVKNADIHATIIMKKGRSNINSGKGSFQIKNLRINPDSSELISIKSFDMLIKGYLLYNADSSCTYSFDSIRFANDKLLLNNFSVHTSSAPGIIRNYRDYSMPYFELLGLDWSELILRQNLKAKEAILHYPTINLRKIKKAGIRKKSIIFNSSHSLDDFMDIDRIKIINGKINVRWGSDNFLQLQGFNLSLSGDNLVDYKNVKLQKDMESLFFRRGYLKIGNIIARLQNVIFKANDQIHAGQLLINSNPEGIDSKIDDVSIKNIYTEENSDNLVIDGLKWEHGTIVLSSVPKSKNDTKNMPLFLKNISGKQTQFKYVNSGIESNAFVEEIQISSLLKKSNSLSINGFKLKGSEMELFNQALRMNCAGFLLSDNSQEFSTVRFEHINHASTLFINAPAVQIRGNINSFFDSGLHLNRILVRSPVINFDKQNISRVAEHKLSRLPAIKIDHIAIQEPVISVQIHQPLSSQDIGLPYSKGNEIRADDVQIASDGIKVGALDIMAKKAEISKGEEVFKIDNGVDLALSKINISLSNDSLLWDAMVRKLNIKNSGGLTFTIKKNKLELQDLALGDFLLSSSSINDIGKLFASNHSARISTTAAKYYTKNSLWQCFNASYNPGQHLLLLDSINYHPSLPLDSAIAASAYQIDYFNFNSSNTKLYGFDLANYFKEGRFTIQKASISRPSIFIYRDKFPPYLSGSIKKMFVQEIRDIQLPVAINQIEIGDGKISYTEKNARTRLEGNLLLTHVNGNFYNIKNYDLQPGDSLAMVFTGRLLDAAFFDLKVKESYVDPKYGFLMTLSIEPTSLIFLNPLLVPLSNIKFTSGRIDSFYMNAKGNENMAYGNMKFYYHRLRLQLLKNGEMSKPTFMNRVASVAVNAFVLKTNNEGRNGLIYFKRLKDRSFFNYMSKIIFSGVTTSVGARKNSQFRKEIANDSNTRGDHP